MYNYDKNSIDEQAEREGQALRESGQRQNVNHGRNREKAEGYNQDKFNKLFWR